MSCLKYVEDSINSNIRTDGRALNTYRAIEINKNVLISADGSSSVMDEENNVICGIKLALVSPAHDKADEGIVNLQIDSPSSVEENRTQKEHLQTMNSIIYNLCIKNNIDKKKLCVLTSEYVWNVDINVMVLNAGGGLLDIISLAIYIALKNTNIPVVQTKKKIEECDVFSNVKKKDYQLSIVENQFAVFPYEDVPICVSVGEFNNKYIYGMSKIEEELAENILVVAVTTSGKCVGFYKLYGITLEISSILHMVENAVKIAHSMFDKIHDALEKIRQKEESSL